MENKKIIDDVHELMKLSNEELDEVLIDQKYNKALLRELVRRSLKVAKDYKKAFDYEKYERKDTEELLRLYNS